MIFSSVSALIALISAVLTSIIGPVMVHFVQLWTNKKPNKDLIKESLETSMLVENKIESIKDNHKADRVWISQFHNGGHYYPTGKSIQKFSMLYETVSLGTISVKMGFQNIPVSLFTRYINHLSEKGIVNIPDFEDETVATYGLKYIAEENNVKSSYIFAIRSIEGRFIGILGVEYTKDKIKLDEDEIVGLEIEATSIGGVLMGLLQTK